MKSLEQINEIAWFLACWHQLKKKLNLDQLFFWMGMVRNGCAQSGCKTLKLNVSQEWAVGINWFFAWCYKLRKAKCCFNDFWVGIAF